MNQGALTVKLAIAAIILTACSPPLSSISSALTGQTTKVFHFDADAQGFVSDPSFQYAGATFQGWVSGDSASGSGGSLEFTVDAGAPEFGVLAAAVQYDSTATWEDWGVPAGATVTSAFVSDYWVETVTDGGVYDHYLTVGVDNSFVYDDQTVYFDYDESADYAWSGTFPGISDALPQAGNYYYSPGTWFEGYPGDTFDTTDAGELSTATPAVRLMYYADPGDGPGTTVRFDDVAVTIKYEGP
jgi:hypothetical protein